MSIFAAIFLSVALFAYIFWPERNPFIQADKTRVDYLLERKEVVYENLRDLSFEFQAGKYPEADYIQQRTGLEDEAAQSVCQKLGGEIEIVNAPRDDVRRDVYLEIVASLDGVPRRRNHIVPLIPDS